MILSRLLNLNICDASVLPKRSQTRVMPGNAVADLGDENGEEFAVLFPETDLVGAVEACERLLETICRAEVDVGQSKVSVAASIGLAMASEARPDGASTLKRADELLYIAKKSGRNRLVADEPEAVGDICNPNVKAAS